MNFKPRQKWAWIGCDPGLDGGVALLHSDASPLVARTPLVNLSGMRTPDVAKIGGWVLSLQGEGYQVTVACEEPFLLRGQRGNLTIGKNWGVLLASFYSLGLDVRVVEPKEWQKVIFEGTSPNPDPKVRAAEFVAREYPDVCLRATKKCSKDHDGIIDAICVATWWRRQCGG